MREVAQAIGTLAATSSHNDKLTLLKRYAGLDGFKEILNFIYNPYIRTGISASKLAKIVSKANNTSMSGEVLTYRDAIEYFKTHTTGNDTDLAYGAKFLRSVLFMHGMSDAYELAKAILTQDLKIGITATSLNKVYGKDFIPKTGCMLGTPYDDVGHDKVAWPCIVTEKLDGIRRIIIKENGVCRAYSRSGHIDEGLVEILAEAMYLPDNTVYDGELLAKGKFKDCIAQRQASNSIANSGGEKTGLTFNVFDMVPLDEFYAGVCVSPAINRKILLGATLMDDSIAYLTDNASELIAAFGIHQELEHIKPVPILGKVNSLLEAEPIVNEIWKAGGEGIMLNTCTGRYEIKRTKHLLKVKHTEEYTLKVVDILEGTGRNEDAMGALVVDFEGAFVGVGSGFTDAQRQDIWENKEDYIGRMIEVETFGKSTNAAGGKSLNCPIFKRFVGDD